jgi:hypothetical protein
MSGRLPKRPLKIVVLPKRGYTNVLKIDLKCPERYIKAYIFFIIQWIEFKFENLKYISIYLTNIEKEQFKKHFLGGNNLT